MLFLFRFCQTSALASKIIALLSSIIASMDETQVMYLLSTIAQVVAALTALTIAGYAFLSDRLKAEAREDETLRDISASIQRRWHHLLLSLIICSSIAVVVPISGIVVFNNSCGHLGVSMICLISMSILFLIVQLVLVTVLVFEVSDPNSLRKAAVREKRHLDKQAAESFSYASRDVAPKSEDSLSDEEFMGRFMKKFAELEGDLNELYRKKSPEPRRYCSVAQSANYLRRLGVLPDELYRPLQAINRYRNAMVHSGDFCANPLVLEELDEVANAIKDIAQGQNET